jgi:serine/threonine protein kinase
MQKIVAAVKLRCDGQKNGQSGLREAMTKPTGSSFSRETGHPPRDGGPTSDALPILQAGTYVGQYEIIGLIGYGGMGAVYEALHPALRKRVAIKVLNPAGARHPEATGRFLREGEAVARIRHPNVVTVTDMGFHEEHPYLVMELLDGIDLAVHLNERGRLSVPETLELLLPVIAAVAAGHEAGVVHRDLKPQNVILVNGEGGELVPKVLDFGLAKLLDESGVRLTVSSEVMGTVAYMSPEQARGARDVDGRSDQYSLGLLLYECITGFPAIDGGNPLSLLRRIGDGRFTPPSLRVRSLPQHFEGVLMRALSVAPDDRYPSVRAFGHALLPFATTRAQATWCHAFDYRLRGTSQRKSAVLRWTMLAAGVGVLLGGVGVRYWHHRPQESLPPVVTERPSITIVPLPDQPPTLRVSVQVVPSQAEITLDGAPVAHGSFERVLPADGARHVLGARARGFEPQTIVFSNAPPPSVLTLTPVPAKPKPARRPHKRPPKPPVKLGPNQTPIIFG